MTNLTQKIKSNSELLSNLCNCWQCQCKVYKIPASYPHLLSLLSRCLISASLNQKSTFIPQNWPNSAVLHNWADSDPENENAADNLPGSVKLDIKSVHSSSGLTSWLIMILPKMNGFQCLMSQTASYDNDLNSKQVLKWFREQEY